MEPNKQQNKSTRTFEEWKVALLKLIMVKKGHPISQEKNIDDQIKPYYDQGLMPDVCYQELFNR